MEQLIDEFGFPYHGNINIHVIKIVVGRIS
jgi:hypothetical protein